MTDTKLKEHITSKQLGIAKMTTIDSIMALAEQYASQWENSREWDKANTALRTAVTELASTATEYQQAADKMAMDHKLERDTLRQQLAEAQALIEASRNQEAVLYQRRMKPDYGPHWTTWDDCSRATFKHYLTVPKLRGWTNEARALFAAPVVAPDVHADAERYRHALNAAANSLDTIAMLAGKKEYGEPPIATYLETFLDVRGYAKNRAMVAIDAAMGDAND